MISKSHARRIRAEIERHAVTLTDETALEVPEMFPMWEPRAYEMGERVRYGGKLYRCIQAHDANETWTPTDAPSLWALVINEGIPEWVQPSSTNPYMKGDKVKHNGKVWESLVDNNVWEPGATGTETLWIIVG